MKKVTRRRTIKRYEQRQIQRNLLSDEYKRRKMQCAFYERIIRLRSRTYRLGILMGARWVLVDTGPLGSVERMIAADQKPESRFLIRQVNAPRDIITEGSIIEVSEFVDRYWKLKAFA